MSSDDTTQEKSPNALHPVDRAAARDAVARAAEASGLSIADWIGDAIKEAGLTEAETAALGAAAATGASLPDWLSDTIKEASVEEAQAAAKSAARSSGAALPDWLSDTIKEASVEEAQVAAKSAARSSGAALPDWLSDTIKEASAEEGIVGKTEKAEAAHTEAVLPEDTRAEKSTVADTDEPAEDEQETLPDWLTEAIKEASAEQSRKTSIGEDESEALPDWLGDAIREVSPEELDAAAMPKKEDRPHAAEPRRLTVVPQLKPVSEPSKSHGRDAPKPAPVTPTQARPIENAPSRAQSPPTRRLDEPRIEPPRAASIVPTPSRGPEGTVRRVPLDALTPSRFQVRSGVEAAEIEALMESIRAHGVLQPIVVRARGVGAVPPYEIIAGERRWRASRQAGLVEVPVSVIEVPDREAMEIALAENLQRHDLPPLDEAEGYRRLVEDMGDTQEHLAQLFGKSRGHISNMLRLLRLPEPIKEMLAAGKLSAGHARALLAVADPIPLAERAVSERLTVREIERIGRESLGTTLAEARVARRAVRRGPAPRDPDLEQIEEELSRLFGVTVKITLRGAGERGSLTIRFKGLEQLHELIERLRL